MLMEKRHSIGADPRKEIRKHRKLKKPAVVLERDPMCVYHIVGIIYYSKTDTQHGVLCVCVEVGTAIRACTSSAWLLRLVSDTLRFVARIYPSWTRSRSGRCSRASCASRRGC